MKSTRLGGMRRERASRGWLAAMSLVCAAGGSLACSATDAPTNSEPAPKYYEDVAPIVSRNCVGCHREGGIAPFALTEYDQVRAHANEIASSTAAREMPPMPV